MDSKQSLIKKNNRDITSVSSLQHEYVAAFDGKNKLKKKQLTVKVIAMPRVYCALEKLKVIRTRNSKLQHKLILLLIQSSRTCFDLLGI
jgi:hypothetical protein